MSAPRRWSCGHGTGWLGALMVALGMHGAAPARTLDIEMEIQHIGGMLDPAELDAWLDSPALTIEAGYEPLQLIEGKTARRIRTMPMGSRLESNLHTVTLQGPQIERAGRTLRFRLNERPPAQEAYRLASVTLSVPVAPGLGRPEPSLRINLLHEPAMSGAHQSAVAGNFHAFVLGARLRYRWSDAGSDWMRRPPICGGDVREETFERYGFRPRHRHAGLFEALSADVASDPPTAPPPGWKSFQMRAPYPPPIDGWQVTRNHMIRIDVHGARIDRLSIFAEHAVSGPCHRTRTYDALLSGGRYVRIERSDDAYGCGAGSPPGQIVRAEWLEDGSLAYFMQGPGADPAVYDAFSIGQPAACGLLAQAPDAAPVEALKAEVDGLRGAFLAH